MQTVLYQGDMAQLLFLEDIVHLDQLIHQYAQVLLLQKMQVSKLEILIFFQAQKVQNLLLLKLMS